MIMIILCGVRFVRAKNQIGFYRPNHHFNAEIH